MHHLLAGTSLRGSAGACGFRREPGSLAIWDNRCTQHNALNDDYGQGRIMRSVTTKGDEPV